MKQLLSPEQVSILKKLWLSTEDFYAIFWWKSFVEKNKLQPKFIENAPQWTVLKVSNWKDGKNQLVIVYIFCKNWFEVFIDGFYLPTNMQGKWIMTSALAALIAIASKLGYKFFTAKLGRDNYPGEIGYHVLPLLGYNGLHKSTKLIALKEKYCKHHKLSAGKTAKIMNAEDIIDLCSFDAGRDCRKEIGRTFDAEFDLHPQSKSMKTFKKHLKKHSN